MIVAHFWQTRRQATRRFASHSIQVMDNGICKRPRLAAARLLTANLKHAKLQLLND